MSEQYALFIKLSANYLVSQEAFRPVNDRPEVSEYGIVKVFHYFNLCIIILDHNSEAVLHNPLAPDEKTDIVRPIVRSIVSDELISTSFSFNWAAIPLVEMTRATKVSRPPIIEVVGASGGGTIP